MVYKTLLIQLGDIGDIIWMLPAIRAVKSAYDDSKVSILVRKPFSGVLEGNPHIDKLFMVPQSSGCKGLRENLALVRSMRAYGFDQVVDFRSGDRGAIMSLLTGAPRRVAMLYRSGVPFWRNWVFTQLVEPEMVKKRGAAEQTLRILREIGIDNSGEIPEIPVTDAKRANISSKLHQYGIEETDKWVSINIFSRWTYKEIKQEKWIEIINWLWSEYGIKTILIGSPDERQKSGKISDSTGNHFLNFAGLTGLNELPALLSLSDLHIGVDSAAPHIAAAVGTPTLTIYGPSDWFEWAPMGDKHEIITSDMDCCPCGRKGCEGSGISKCLDELPVEKIKAAIKKRI
jgi:heptosyltransferase-3